MNAEFKLDGLEIETARLLLRPFKETDLDDFYEYACVEGVGEMAGWPHHKNKEESAGILDGFIKTNKTFAICLKENNQVIGSLGIEKYPLEAELTQLINYKGRELGFVLSKEYWGQGLMMEAVKAVIDYLFNKLNYDFIFCCHYTWNKQSKRVQEKCGFKPFGKGKRETLLGTSEESIFNLLINPHSKLQVEFPPLENLLNN